MKFVRIDLQVIVAGIIRYKGFVCVDFANCKRGKLGYVKVIFEMIF